MRLESCETMQSQFARWLVPKAAETKRLHHVSRRPALSNSTSAVTSPESLAIQ